MIQCQLLPNEVLDKDILDALDSVPREPFLPEKLRGAAYIDGDIEMSPGRYLMAPLTFARLLQMAKITYAARVLVVGALNGYAPAVVSRLAVHVTAIDTDAAMLAQAAVHLERLGIRNVTLQQVSSLIEGGATPPYNVIIIHGAVVTLPERLAMQMALGGRLATIRNAAQRPGLKGGLGKGLLVQRLGDQLQYREHFDAAAAVLPGFERPASFRL
jgi:protein-L-isoaspartate(D-aspartate) O-methyltransferase